ncbi:ABC transporter permease [Microterricola viridarii]|uniref:Transport permease protein n=1 Tax=Microterricola viridarii TaxID=412690 RepID=A0A1H1QXM0_9MICO|nr:ABC transporter permease [Microterricola viridarii]SDS28140.1 ABC-2 type transport system permease protein [Microterricola viridarii]
MSAQDRFDSLAQQKLVTVGSAQSRSALHSIREIFQQREMLSLLVRRDLKSRYKDSALGFVWTLVRPLTQLLIYYIVIGQFLSAARAGGIPDFAIYVFTGLTAYGLLSETIGGGTSSIVGNAGLIKKIYLPREVFPLASVGSALFNFLIQLGILLVATLIAGAFPIHADVFYAIPALMVLLVFGMALGLFFAAVNVYLRDIQYLVEVMLLLLLWASPIVYSWSMVKNAVGDGLLLDIYTNNPITLAVLGFQKAFWTAGSGVAEYPVDLLPRLGIAFVVGLVLLAIAQRVFSKLQGNFAQAL